MKFKRDDFGNRGKKRRGLVTTPKSVFMQLDMSTLKPLNLTDVAAALEKVIPDRTLVTGVPKAKIYLMRSITDCSSSKPNDIVSIDDNIVMSNYIHDFHQNVTYGAEKH